MGVPTSKLQQLTIFTTLLTGGGVSTMYYLMQKKFAESDYHKLAVQKLQVCTVAMESLGAPPLKVHNIHLTDRHNQIDQQTAQIKIPVTGSKTGGYLYTSSVRDPETNRNCWFRHGVQVVSAQTSQLGGPRFDSTLGHLCVEFACSPREHTPRATPNCP
uniref:cytochrome c oxidase assembly factor 1 homolog isoform X1 n=1 Tax=Doryrhamphus excisus TaxID=161450 RepID=UPI0025ADE729|nr:cytochrome c oxidase assembly factor 1 homolog isoform X1 [Doryrhamphus excisus]XP_057930075.1 cytochrome c oxidase assembly factor 1 homolog isoform X1 [Doryrhamphus excisus]